MSFLTSETDNKIRDTVFIETKFNTLLEEMHFLIVLLGVSLTRGHSLKMIQGICMLIVGSIIKYDTT